MRIGVQECGGVRTGVQECGGVRTGAADCVSHSVQSMLTMAPPRARKRRLARLASTSSRKEAEPVTSWFTRDTGASREEAPS